MPEQPSQRLIDGGAGGAIVGPHVRAVVGAPIALRAAGAAWIRHWESVLSPALEAVDGQILSAVMTFAGAEITAVASDPSAAFRTIVRVLDESPEARDYTTRVDLVGLDLPVEERSYRKRPAGPATS